MATLTRREADEREAAVLRFFIENPRATGDEAQAALIGGKLTGKKGPPMGIGKLYRLKRQAEGQARRGTSPAAAPAPTPNGGASLEDLRSATVALQRVLAGMPEIAEVRVTAQGATVLRRVVQEEKL